MEGTGLRTSPLLITTGLVGAWLPGTALLPPGEPQSWPMLLLTLSLSLPHGNKVQVVTQF